MSSTVGYASQGKPWWARSKSTKDPSGLRHKLSSSNLSGDSEKYSSAASQRSSKSKDSAAGSKLNTLASAIGFKSKKLPTLDIQDPPPLPLAHHAASEIPAPSAFFTNRPPAKSVSSTVRSSSYEGDEASDSFHAMSEPRTPSDHPRDRTSYQNSLMTFSEMDPFAAGGVIIQHASQDPYRHSGISDSSLLEPQFKTRDLMPMPGNRVSYASSSSQSHTRLSDPYSPNLVSPRSLLSERFPSDFGEKDDIGSLDAFSANPVDDARARLKKPSGSNSSCSTVTPTDFRSRLSEPSNNTRTANARPRGMTVAADESHNSPHLELRRKASEPHGLHVSARPPLLSSSPVTFRYATPPPDTSSPSAATRPLVVVRKASSTRVQIPPPSRAPPSTNLPPPPQPPLAATDRTSLEDSISMLLSDPSSPSSSRLSLTPSIDLAAESADAMSQSLMGFPKPPSMDRRQSGNKAYRIEAHTSPPTGFRHVDLRNSSTSRLSSSSSLVQSMHAVLDERSLHRPSMKSLKKPSSQQSLTGRRQSSQSASSSFIALAESESGASGPSHLPAPSSKAPRKQRSFQQSRLPLPPLPILRHSPSTNNSPVPPPDPHISIPSSPTKEQRRGYFTSATPSATRKRLFSGSSIRRSTSSHGLGSPPMSPEDDVRSLLSVDELPGGLSPSGPQKLTMSFGLGSPLSLTTRNACVSPTSYWNDSGDVSMEHQEDKRTSASMSDYTPQHIIPPSDMLKLEEQLEKEAAAQREREAETDRKPKLDLQPGDFGFPFVGRRPRVDSRGSRPRADSMMSTGSAGTLAFGIPGEERKMEVAPTISSPIRHVNVSRTVAGFASPSSSHKQLDAVASSSRLPTRAGSLQAKPPQKPLPLSIRPSTAQPDIPSPASPTFTSFQQLSPERPPMSLPPPPRRPPRDDRPARDETYNKRASVVPLHPLSPPPQRSRTSSGASRPIAESSWSSTVASPPTHLRALNTPPSAFDTDRIMKRRSIMKKPSFLDIEDEFETAENLLDVEIDVPPTSPLDSSFLDMDRGRDSFDTIGSSETSYYR